MRPVTKGTRARVGSRVSSMDRRTLDQVPPAPREPSPRARELIFRYQGSQRAMLLVGAIFAAVGVVFAVIFCWGLPGHLAIAAGGTPVHRRGRSRRVGRPPKINRPPPPRLPSPSPAPPRRAPARRPTPTSQALPP